VGEEWRCYLEPVLDAYIVIMHDKETLLKGDLKCFMAGMTVMISARAPFAC